jgi:hypothetical protein
MSTATSLLCHVFLVLISPPTHTQHPFLTLPLTKTKSCSVTSWLWPSLHE